MTTTPTTIHLTAPGELVEMVPYLLGFHPRDSLVLVGLSAQPELRPASYRVEVTLRADLPHPCAAPAVVDRLARTVSRAGVRCAVALVYGPDPLHPRVRRVGALVESACDRAGLMLADHLFATELRWWSVLCANKACCPPEGRPRSRSESRVAAEATFAGLVAVADRAVLRDRIAPLPDGRDRVSCRAVEGAATRLAAAWNRDGQEPTVRREVRAIARIATDWARRDTALVLTKRHLARFGAALGRGAIRDRIWLAVDQEQLDGSALMQQLLRRLPPPHNAAPLFLYAWHQWRLGNGTMASLAASECLRADGDYTAAKLLMSVVALGLDPRTTPRLATAAVTC